MILATCVLSLIITSCIFIGFIFTKPMLAIALFGRLTLEIEEAHEEFVKFTEMRKQQVIDFVKRKINTMVLIEIIAKIRTKYIKTCEFLFPSPKDTLIIKDNKMIAFVIIKGKPDTIEIPFCVLDGCYKVKINNEPVKTFTEGIIEGSDYSNTYTVLGRHDKEVEITVENAITEESVSKTFTPGEIIDLDWVTV